MKEQILPPLPIVGSLKLSSKDGKSICQIEVVKKQKASTKIDPLFNSCFEELKAYLTGESKLIKIPLDLSGLTPFQMKVLKQMKEIPYGKVESYKGMGTRMKSAAYQAIGSACGRNPFLLIYPCHRVVGEQGLGGFAHGLEMKKKLLKLEGFL